MSYTNGDDPHLDAEIEGRIARRQRKPFIKNPYYDDPTLERSWYYGWVDEDAQLRAGR